MLMLYIAHTSFFDAIQELPMTFSQKVAVVTDSSSDMGFETSLMLARNGFHTYATMRKLEGGGGS